MNSFNVSRAKGSVYGVAIVTLSGNVTYPFFTNNGDQIVKAVLRDRLRGVVLVFSGTQHSYEDTKHFLYERLNPNLHWATVGLRGFSDQKHAADSIETAIKLVETQCK